MTKHFLLLTIFSMLSFSCLHAQNDSFQKQWEAVQHQLEKGLPKSAATLAEKILAEAKKQENTPQVIKAQLFLMQTRETTEEDATVQNIQQAESFIKQTQGVEQAIWQSITAEQYWRYFQRNRWKIYQRTSVAGPPSEDIAVWSADQFFEHISALYVASITQQEALQKVRVEQYAPLVDKGKNTRELRPSMYDLLAFRALDFFQNDEKDLNQPAFNFQIEATGWFAPAASFIDQKMTHPDSTSLQILALKSYQKLLKRYLQKDLVRALIDADLHRLEFVYDKSVHPHKDSLYLEALRTLEKQYPALPETAEVSFRIAKYRYTGGFSSPGIPLYRYDQNTNRPERDLPAICKQLQAIISSHPNTEGASHAQQLLQDIEDQELGIQVEEVQIPHENIRALVRYKNTRQLHLHLIRIPNATSLAQYANEDTLTSLLKHNTPIWTGQETLPGTEDMENHTIEVKIDPQKAGLYILAASLEADLNKKENILSSTLFQVSSMALLSQSKDRQTWLYTLNRESGKPMQHVQLTFWKQKWNSQKSTYDFTRTKQAKSNAAGVYLIDPKADFDYVTAIQKQDTLQQRLRHNRVSDTGPKQIKPTQRTFFFTDRSIYRPGQTIYFKGIQLESQQQGLKNRTLSNRDIEVTLYDANGQEVDTLTLKTNAYGSFAGTFIAPRDIMTGNMRISSADGSTAISVEEYKRPKFYVQFDTLKAQYALEQEISVQGSALAYAGNNVSDAQVRYRVIRTARFPYFWAAYRFGGGRSAQREIANGTTQTDANGRFRISFTSLPDKGIDPQSLPVFNYQIIAEITDINGETQTGYYHVKAGYRSLQILSSIPEEALSTQMDTVSIHTLNLNNQFTPAKLSLHIKRLKFPGKLYRKRLWDLPDQFLYSEDQFRTYFPNDAYKQEDDYHYWEAAETVYSHTWTTKESGLLEIPDHIWTHPGWYVFEISGKDMQGKEVLEKQYSYVAKPKSKDISQLPIIALQAQNSYAPGDQAEIWVKNGFKDTYVLETNTLEDSPAQAVSPEIHYTRVIKEADRGGITYAWMFLHNNRIYQTETRLHIPWDERDLSIDWSTHRSNLRPGDQEEWTFTIRGHKKEALAAEMVATLYDASLDAFKPHRWSRDLLIPPGKGMGYWRTNIGFGLAPNFLQQTLARPSYPAYVKIYDRLISTGMQSNLIQEEVLIRGYSTNTGRLARGIRGVAVADAAPPAPAPAAEIRMPVGQGPIGDEASSKATSSESQETIPLRTNLQETAFFFPQLQSNAQGEIEFRFTAPEALTEWHLMTFAHTTDWKTGFLDGKIRTQKELMVTPNLPRFFRQGDQIEVSTKIANLSAETLEGKARLEIIDALTMQALDTGFTLDTEDKTFRVDADGSTSVSWKLEVPGARYTPVVVRISANTDHFKDGEEHVIPVITNRTLVTETLPLWIHGNQEKSLTWEALNPGKTPSLEPHKLTLEFTGNPAWYAVQALPYLTEDKFESAENIFNRYYANTLAAYITRRQPNIQEVFEQWNTQDSSSLESALQQNQELKSLLLEETPWVMEAKNESEQKHRIKALFEQKHLQSALQTTLRKLLDTQLDDGGFPWFKGMYHNRYITQYITAGIGRLNAMGAMDHPLPELDKMLDKAIAYADRQVQADYLRLIKTKADLEEQHISYDQIFYLYMRSFYKDRAIPDATAKAFDYYKKQAARYWNHFNPYMKAQIALALYRFGETTVPGDILASLKETAVVSEELGMYWKNGVSGYYWYQAPIEAQAQIIETFSEIRPKEPIIDDLRIWLLKQKQTQHWNTSKSTADACYALLIRGTDWLKETPEVKIQLGNETIRSSQENTLAGTGYFKKTFEPEAITPEMRNIRVQVDKTQDTGTAWGGLYWQYFEDLDKIKSAETPLSIRKSLYLVRNTDKGPVLTEINQDNTLQVGDKVTVRMEIRVDRDMEYVHLKDMRASTFEPLNVLSAYKSQGGLGYFENTRDLSTNFFFDYLRKGTYVFEYPVYVSQKGNFSNGIATIQSMYAPEFSSHSEGIRVQVE